MMMISKSIIALKGLNIVKQDIVLCTQLNHPTALKGLNIVKQNIVLCTQLNHPIALKGQAYFKAGHHPAGKSEHEILNAYSATGSVRALKGQAYFKAGHRPAGKPKPEASCAYSATAQVYALKGQNIPPQDIVLCLTPKTYHKP